MPLHHVSPNQISGLIEALAAPPYDGKADLPDIAYEQELEVDELFPGGRSHAAAAAWPMWKAATSSSPIWASASPTPN